MKYLVGVDEAGRGPLAGPVSVGAVLWRGTYVKSSVFNMFEGLNDSKKLTARARERLYARLVEARDEGLLDFAVCFSSHTIIDRQGIVPAIRSALARALGGIACGDAAECRILLDGGLRAPAHFTDQETIIRGDGVEPLIMLAAIAAKVERDTLMRRAATQYPHYGFETHKGYGTRAHYEALHRHGPCELHRMSFLKSL